MPLAQLFYLREAVRRRARSLRHRLGRRFRLRRTSPLTSPRASRVARQFLMESLEPRVLLSATPTTATLEMVALDPATNEPAVASSDTSETNGQTLTPEASAQIAELLNSQPMSFEANVGQTDDCVAFLSRGDGYTLFLTSTEAVMSLNTMTSPGPSILDPADPLASVTGQFESASNETEVLRLTLEGANPAATITGLESLPGIVNYLTGNDPSQWYTDVPTFQKVLYDEVYDGIDLLYYGNFGQLEYDWVVAPGADLSQIRLGLTGADAVEIDVDGNLELTIAGRTVDILKPVAYQIINGQRLEVQASYLVTTDASGLTIAALVVGAYDAQQTLIIDPVLSYSTYLGGSSDDLAFGIAVDGSGQAYVTGRTFSSSFPTLNASQPFIGGDYDVFVTKLNASGGRVYSTYLGGSGEDMGWAIAVDGSGQAYVTGSTFSVNFPILNASQPTRGGGLDAFVTKLNASGGRIYSTYLGGGDWDVGLGIAVDGSGQAYVTGWTLANNFPTLNASQPTFGGNRDAFVTKFTASGARIYSTYLGGSGEDSGEDIAVDGSGQAYVTGYTFSANFPTLNASQPTYGGNRDAFVTKLNVSGGRIYSTFVGGNSDDVGNGIAVDASGQVYLTGYTFSANFPTLNASQMIIGGSRDAFVTNLNASGVRVYSTYLGGSSADDGRAIAVDGSGQAYVTGYTASTNFPTLNSSQMTIGGGEDAFVTKLNVSGGRVYSTYLGGNDSDAGFGIAVDSTGQAYVTGYTFSTNFPTVNAIQPFTSGSPDAFVVKLSSGMSVAPTLQISGASSVNEGAVYTLNLSSSDPDTGTISYWDINWGDGSDPDGDQVVGEIVPGDPSTVTHIYADGTRSYTILASATDEEGTYQAQAFGTNGIVSLDPSFGTGGVVKNDFVASTSDFIRDSVIVQPDGKILVVGNVSGGISRIGMARYNTDGTRDLTFGTNGSGVTEFDLSQTAESVVLDSNGKILVAGSDGIARYNSDGSLDNTFGISGLNNTFTNLNKIMLDGSGRIVVSGTNRLARLLADGTVDSSFDLDGQIFTGSMVVQDFTIDASGNYILVGYTYNGTNNDITIRRYNSLGQLDSGYATGGTATFNFGGQSGDIGYAVTLHGTGVVVAGQAVGTWNGSTYDFYDQVLIKLNASGLLDSSFGSGGIARYGNGTPLYQGNSSIIKVDSASRILIGGSYGVARFSATGALDTSFGGGDGVAQSFELGQIQAVEALSVDPLDRIIVGGGRFNGVSATSGWDFAIARLNASNGSLDTSFGVGGNDGSGVMTTDFIGSTSDAARDLVEILPDGKILAVGYAQAGSSNIVLARYMPDGTLDTTFAAGDGDGINGFAITDFGGFEQGTSLAVDSSGRIYVSYSNVVVRYNSNGILDATYGSSGRAFTNLSLINDLAVDATGKVVAAGYMFRTINGMGTPDFGVTRLLTTGSVDTTFGISGVAAVDFGTTGPVNSQDIIQAMTIASNGNIVVTGYTYKYFTSSGQFIGQNPLTARFTSSGALDTTFGTGGYVETNLGFSSAAQSLTIDGSGRIVVSTANRLLRYSGAGILDSSFDSDGIVAPVTSAYKIAIDQTGKIVTAGGNTLARYNENGTADTSFSPSGWISTPFGSAEALLIDNLNRIVVAGQSSTTSSSGADFMVARYITQGLSLTVANVAPQVNSLTAPTTGVEGTAFSLLVTATDPAGAADPLTFSWTITRNGNSYLVASGSTITVTPVDDGTYVATVSINDGDGGTTTGSRTISVINVAPTATFNSPATVNEGDSITLSLTSPVDPSNTDTTVGFQYAFDMGSGFGAYGSNNSASFTTTDNGLLTVRGKIRDKDGGETTYTSTVTVANVAPVLAPIGNKSVNEQDQLSFSISGTDVDVLTYSASGLPAGATFDAPTRTFSWTPSEAQGPGSYDVTFKVSDGLLTTSETITVTVNEINVAPVLAPIGNKSVNEQSLLQFTISGSDVDFPAQTLVYSASGLPGGAAFDVPTRTFSWTPSEAQGPGSYDVTFKVSDGLLTTSETITITVAEVNMAPVLAPIGNKTVNEQSLLQFSISGSDVDFPAQTLVYSASGLPGGAAFDVPTRTFSWTPSEAQGPGSYDVTFKVSDGLLTTSETITITVAEVNMAPVLAPIGNKSVNEQSLLQFTISGSDVDFPGQTLVYSASGLPGGATFDPTTRQFSWTPSEAQGPGSFDVTFSVSDGLLTTNEAITITVAEVNVAPVLNTIGNKSVNEQNLLQFTISGSDVDFPGQTLVYSASGLPGGATFDPTTRQFSWTPSEAQGPGSYEVTFSMTDGVLTTSETITITVAEVNVAPVLAPIGNKSINEQSLLQFTINGSDVDVPLQALTFSATDLPPGATFDAPTRTFSWTPTEVQGPGTYNVTFSVTDGLLTTSETITITVDEVNVAPLLNAIGNKTVNEQTELRFTISGSDVDVPVQNLIYSATGLPAGATFDATTRQFSWTPSEAQGPGSYNVTFSVSDGLLTTSETITITVAEVNVAPVLNAIGNKSVNEQNLLQFTINGSDVDVPLQALTFNATGLPTGATFDAPTRTFTWSPTELQGPGAYNVTFSVTDGLLTASETITITVNEVNVAPVLAPIGNKSINEQSLLQFTISGSDVDFPAQTLIYSASGLPAGATFDAATRTFSWTPSEVQGPGTYNVTFKVSDGLLTTSETITITVNEVNIAPVLNAIGNKSVNEQSLVQFTISGSDVDVPVQNLTYSASGLPAGATFDAATRTFSWTPTEVQGPGTYNVTFNVSDGLLTTSETITITVNEVNIAPVLNAIGNKSINEQSLLQFTISGTDVDFPAQTLVYSASGLPAGATFSAATRQFSWTPSEAQGPGTYNVTFSVTDGLLTTSETITITVNEVNIAPVLNAIGNKSINEQSLLQFTISGSDVDFPAQTLFYSASGLPAGATFDATTRQFSWTPSEVQGPGTYNVTFSVSDGLLTASETITITVNEVNVAPVLASIGNKSVNEQSLLQFTISGSDVDVPVQNLTYSATGLPSGATFDATTRQFSWTPGEAQGPGSYNVTFRVTDGVLTTSETITITVNEVNVAPVLNAIGNKTVNEGSTLTFTASASDVDIPIQSLTFGLAPGAPAGASIHSTSGIFTWTPTEGPGASPYSVTVRVTDGVVTTSETIGITVNNVAPTVSLTPPSNIQEGVTASYSIQFQDPGVLDTHMIQINWGDGTPLETVNSAVNAAAGVTILRNHTYGDDGTYTIGVTVTDDDGQSSQTSRSVTVANVGPAVSVTPATQTKQYSDSITPIVIAATDVAADKMNISTAWSTNGTIWTTGLPDELTITGGLSLTGAANQVGTVSWTISGVADLDPAKTYTIRVTVTDEDGGSTVKQSVIDIDQENARTTYTGVLYASTPSITTTTTTIQLRATVQDITAVLPGSDADAGLITKATVTFINRDTNTVIASNVPITLVNSADPKTGTAVYNWTVTLPTNSSSQSYTIGVIVNGYYTRNASADNTVVTVSLPQQDSLTGGGYLINQTSAGTYAGDAGSQTNFGFNVKFNKQLTNLQGNVNVIIRQGDRVYQVKTNAMNSLTVSQVSTGVYDATFTSKANLTDITDPLNPISLGGNLDLIVTLRDGGEPGTADTIGITLWRNSTLLFSSNWNGTQTVKQLLGGGNLQVRKSSALLAEGGALTEDGSLPKLTITDLTPIIEAAKARWIASGLTAEQAATLAAVDVRIADLEGGTLGTTEGTIVWLDQTAAGYGWFIDATPGDNAEYHFVKGLAEWLADGHSSAAGGMDLLTTIMHEFGHVLGYGDQQAQHRGTTLMTETLSTGVRRMVAAEPVSAPEPGAIDIPNGLLAGTPLPVTQLQSPSSNQFAGSVYASSKSMATKSSDETTPPVIEWTDGESKLGRQVISSGGANVKSSWWRSFLFDSAKVQQHPPQQIEVALPSKKK